MKNILVLNICFILYTFLIAIALIFFNIKKYNRFIVLQKKLNLLLNNISKIHITIILLKDELLQWKLPRKG